MKETGTFEKKKLKCGFGFEILVRSFFRVIHTEILKKYHENTCFHLTYGTQVTS